MIWSIRQPSSKMSSSAVLDRKKVDASFELLVSITLYPTSDKHRFNTERVLMESEIRRAVGSASGLGTRGDDSMLPVDPINGLGRVICSRECPSSGIGNSKVDMDSQ